MFEKLRPGTLRYFDAEGVERRASPGDALYSTVTMVATEFWDVTRGEWRAILPAEDKDPEP